MFEVGKHYRHTASHRVIVMLFVGKQIAVGRTVHPGETDDDPGDEVAIHSHHSLWKEHAHV